MKIDDVIAALTEPKELYSYSDIPNVTTESGIYAWYFKELPPHVPEDNDYKTKDDKMLLYVGSGKSLKKRIRNHSRQDGVGSTLRRSLNTLFFGKPFVFDSQVTKQLEDWMKENAFVCWIENEYFEDFEKDVIRRGWLPLNISHSRHPFSKKLKAMRNQS